MSSLKTHQPLLTYGQKQLICWRLEKDTKSFQSVEASISLHLDKDRLRSLSLHSEVKKNPRGLEKSEKLAKHCHHGGQHDFQFQQNVLQENARVAVRQLEGENLLFGEAEPEPRPEPRGDVEWLQESRSHQTSELRRNGAKYPPSSRKKRRSDPELLKALEVCLAISWKDSLNFPPALSMLKGCVL